ncbi:MAG: LTA synthase family protein [Candidatus Pristimantibacillus lignocellulolyticus]|uniref:LTA synthase family protein n=1 Tax=Candidatus Pristimantibacillus lignocellulolyticus TaxID=2994561 RepID=A0A9J6ZLC1_9BACL|nr:MAG: LTA synthase family protein [Candidatus Pristimantibacillus lignocellulolyticus]
MLLKSSLAWMVIFEGGASWTLLLKELPFVLIVFCLIECFAKKRKMLYYWIANLLMTSILFAVIMYYKYYGVIVTYFALAQVNQVTAVKNSVFSLMDPYFLFIYIDVVIMAFFIFIKRKPPGGGTPPSGGSSSGRGNSNKRSIRFALPILIVSLVVCLFNVVPNRASMNELVKAEQMGILNYEAYMILSSKDKEFVEPEHITQEAINKIKNVNPVTEPYLYGTAEGKNVIILQMESFQNFLVNLKIDGQEITPNFNKLVKENYYFNKFYQQVGQGNTSDAEYVVNSSLYIPARGAATQMYADRELPSLPKLLEEHNYDTATFHTNVVEFWNRGELYESLGFNHYYDSKYFGEEDTVFFGASDNVLYRKTLDKLVEMDAAENPFYSQVISMTAHHPYTLPEDKQLISLPERFQNTLVGNYIVAQNYADHALGVFIQDLKDKGIWEDSLIVMYGDHLGLPIYSLDNHERELMNEIYGREYAYTDMINVPLVIINEGVSEGQTLSQIGGQVDVLPTIANLLGISVESQIHFGQDIFNQTENILPQRYYLPTGSFLTSEELFLSGSGYEDGRHYSLSGHNVDNGLATESEFQSALDLLKLSDSYVNSLPLKKSAVKDEK